MKPLYDINGLFFFTEEEIRLREVFASHFKASLEACLMAENPAFRFVQIEAPILTPSDQIAIGYGNDDLWAFGDEHLSLRPETTAGSYWAAKVLLDSYHVPKYRLPLVVWQHGKSFRREQDQVMKNMRLKEFYQQEFQILFGETTANDYYAKIVEATRLAISEMIGHCHSERSDRLPDYSTETTDIIRTEFAACNDILPEGIRVSAMEVCSISRRKDFPGAKNIEVSIGTDRCVFNYLIKDDKRALKAFGF